MKKPKLEKFFNSSATISLVANGLRLQRSLNTGLAHYGVNLNQALILLAIFFEPENKIRSGELLGVIPTTKGNLSHCTSFLEQKNFLSRQILPDDLRSYEFRLTTKGQKLCISLIKFFNSIEEACDQKFSIQKLKDFITLANQI